MVSTYLIFTWSAIVILSWHKAFEFVASLVKYFQLLSFYVFYAIRNHRCWEVHSWSMVISYDMLENWRQISWRLDRFLLSRNSFQTLHQIQQDVFQIQARYFHLLFLWILYWSSDSVLSCGFTIPNQTTDHVLVINKLTICCLRCFTKNKSHWEIRGQKVPSMSLFFQIEFLTIFVCFYHQAQSLRSNPRGKGQKRRKLSEERQDTF